jgi:hypothetical protein
MAKKLNPRQRKLVKTLAAGATLTDAAKAAGYKAKDPRKSGSQVMNTIATSGAGADFLDRMGLTDEVLYSKYIYPLLEATEVKFFQSEGKVTQQKIVADNTTRRYMVDIVCRIKGLYKGEAEPQATGVKVILIDRSNRPPRAPAIDIPTLAPEELTGEVDADK